MLYKANMPSLSIQLDCNAIPLAVLQHAREALQSSTDQIAIRNSKNNYGMAYRQFCVTSNA